MVELGYALSSEEHAPRDLVGFAKRAEETGVLFRTHLGSLSSMDK
jgi:hypothetical protein